jgi:RimJ/RimL family protein N-acetyltransferase
MNAMPLPLGPFVEGAPAGRPGPVTLAGRFARIEKLDAARHAAGLWQNLAGHEAVWAYMAQGPFAGEASFAAWLSERAASADPFFYAVCDVASGAALGLFALMEARPAMRVIEVGTVVYAPALQRTPAATEAQYLAARYVFETLGYRRYEWKCNALHAGSMAAARRLGFTYEGTFRQHMIVKGRNRDTAWFSMTDGEWPAVKAAFQAWLDPANFDGNGRQRTSLAAMREGKREKA